MLINGQLLQRRHLMGTILGRAVTRADVSIDCRAQMLAASGFRMWLSMEDRIICVFVAKGDVRLDEGSFSNLIGSDLISFPADPRGTRWRWDR